jgi:hypothetical protein
VNFVDARKSPEKIRTLLKNACYDCHSNETVYPKYAFIAPVSWSVKSHVNEGREHLNFSVWGTYNKDLKENMLLNLFRPFRTEQCRCPDILFIIKKPIFQK